ncbi:hypothetical protein D3C81_2255430 [compost metagenome]
MTTVAPWAANALAVALPIPRGEAAPVIMTTLFSTSIFVSFDIGFDGSSFAPGDVPINAVCLRYC